MSRQSKGEFRQYHTFDSNHGGILAKVLEFSNIPEKDPTERIDAFILMFDLSTPLTRSDIQA